MRGPRLTWQEIDQDGEILFQPHHRLTADYIRLNILPLLLLLLLQTIDRHFNAKMKNQSEIRYMKA